MRHKRFTKEELKKINPLQMQHHYISTRDWINQCFVIQKDASGREIFVPDRTIVSEDGTIVNQNKYKIKRVAELWMISLVILMDLEFNVRAKNMLNKTKTRKEINDFAFYGSYKGIRNQILDSVDPKLRPQLSRSITIRTISTAMKRAEVSGFVKIEYNESINRKNCTHEDNFRRIMLQYDKLKEVSTLDPFFNKSLIWQKFHRCSREHRWMRKRPISYLKPLIDDLADKNKKEEFKQKLAKLKLKYKNEQDVLKAFIIKNQKQYSANAGLTKKLTTIKSVMDEADKQLMSMYHNVDVDTGEVQITPEQRAILQAFYQAIV